MLLFCFVHLKWNWYIIKGKSDLRMRVCVSFTSSDWKYWAYLLSAFYNQRFAFVLSSRWNGFRFYLRLFSNNSVLANVITILIYLLCSLKMFYQCICTDIGFPSHPTSLIWSNANSILLFTENFVLLTNNAYGHRNLIQLRFLFDKLHLIHSIIF